MAKASSIWRGVDAVVMLTKLQCPGCHAIGHFALTRDVGTFRCDDCAQQSERLKYSVHGARGADGWRGHLTLRTRAVVLDSGEMRALANELTVLADAFDGRDAA